MLSWMKNKLQAKKDSLNIELQRKIKNKLKTIDFSTFSIQGDGPRKSECQDSYSIIDGQKDHYYSFGVFDGYGNSGKEASNAVSENFHKFFEKNFKKIQSLKTKKEREEFLKKAYENAESKMKSSGIDYNLSGSCVNFIFIKDNLCTISNLGDSRAVLCRIGKDINAIELSWDHKPTRKDEKQRIVQNGGKIEKLNFKGEWVGPF